MVVDSGESKRAGAGPACGTCAVQLEKDARRYDVSRLDTSFAATQIRQDDTVLADFEGVLSSITATLLNFVARSADSSIDCHIHEVLAEGGYHVHQLPALIAVGLDVALIHIETAMGPRIVSARLVLALCGEDDGVGEGKDFSLFCGQVHPVFEVGGDAIEACL